LLARPEDAALPVVRAPAADLPSVGAGREGVPNVAPELSLSRDQSRGLVDLVLRSHVEAGKSVRG